MTVRKKTETTISISADALRPIIWAAWYWADTAIRCEAVAIEEGNAEGQAVLRRTIDSLTLRLTMLGDATGIGRPPATPSDDDA